MKILWMYSEDIDFEERGGKDYIMEDITKACTSHLLKRGELLEDISVEIVERYIPHEDEDTVTVVSKCLELLNECDSVYFSRGWERDNTCQIVQFTSKRLRKECCIEA